MLHFANNNHKCRTCLPFIGFKLAIITIFGIIIGFAGLRVVEQPPSSILITATAQQTEHMNTILVKLNTMERDIEAIKNNLIDVRKKLNIRIP